MKVIVRLTNYHLVALLSTTGETRKLVWKGILSENGQIPCENLLSSIGWDEQSGEFSFWTQSYISFIK